MKFQRLKLWSRDLWRNGNGLCRRIIKSKKTPIVLIVSGALAIGWKAGRYQTALRQEDFDVIQDVRILYEHRIRVAAESIAVLEAEIRALYQEAVLCRRTHVDSRQDVRAETTASEEMLPEFEPQDHYFTPHLIQLVGQVISVEQHRLMMTKWRAGLLQLMPDSQIRSVRQTPRNSWFFTRNYQLAGYKFKYVPFPIVMQSGNAFEVHHVDENVFIFLFVDEETAQTAVPFPITNQRITAFPEPTEDHRFLLRVSLSRIEDVRSADSIGNGAVTLNLLRKNNTNINQGSRMTARANKSFRPRPEHLVIRTAQAGE